MDYKNINVNQYLDELNKCCDEEKARNELFEILSKIGRYGNKFKPELGAYVYVIIGAITLLIGIICKMQLELLIFGFIFFLAGFFIGMYVPIFGLLFLFAHGACGLFLMIGEYFKNLLTNPLLTDGFSPLLLIIIVSILCIIAGFVTTIMFNLSRKIKEVKNFKYLPFLLINIGLILIFLTNVLF